MNKIALFISFFIFPITVCLAVRPSIGCIRSLYRQASTEEAACKELIDILKPFNPVNDPLRSGYRACGLMMMAQYTLNPFKKLSYFSKGKKILELAITEDENNVELRFLRFTIQNSAPAFLGYRNEVYLDKVFVLKFVGQIEDREMKDWVISVLDNSSLLSENKNKTLSL